MTANVSPCEQAWRQDGQLLCVFMDQDIVKVHIP